MEFPLLRDIAIIFAVAILVGYVCFRLGVPAILGFLIAGGLVGPHGLGLVESQHEVELLAEIGVVLLLFTIGLEFSLKKLLAIGRLVLLGGTYQVGLTIVVLGLFAYALGARPGAALFFGFLFSLSSTAIVLRVLQDRSEIESPHGVTALGILIFQDIVIVPMMLVAPFLGSGITTAQSPVLLLLRGLGVLGLVGVAARWVVPALLFRVAQTRSRELFLLANVVICFAVAWLTSAAGLSLALGAFLAGLVIAESDYGQEALGAAIPFRDAFTSFFFVSIGMLLHVETVLDRPALVLLTTLAVLVLKTLVAAGSGLLLGLPLRSALLAGFALCQVGEFAFILSGVGVRYQVLNDGDYQVFLAVAILTMAAAPFLIAVAPGLVEKILRLPIPPALRRGHYAVGLPEGLHFAEHLIIVGYGVNGRNVTRAARAAGIDFAVLDLNPGTIRAERERGLPIFFGDATRESVLDHIGVQRARVLVVVANDPPGVRRIVELARRRNPGVYIIVRTRFVREMHALYQLGADEVIPEEFETSVEIFSRVLSRYQVPRAQVEKLILELRADNYRVFRSQRGIALHDVEERMPGLDFSVLHLGDSPWAGSTIGAVELRKKHGVTVVAIRRGAGVIQDPGAGTVLAAGDLLYVIGSPEKVASVARTIGGEPEVSISP